MRHAHHHEMIAAPLTDLVIGGNHHAALALAALHLIHIVRIHIGR